MAQISKHTESHKIVILMVLKRRLSYRRETRSTLWHCQLKSCQLIMGGGLPQTDRVIVCQPEERFLQPAVFVRLPA